MSDDYAVVHNTGTTVLREVGTIFAGEFHCYRRQKKNGSDMSLTVPVEIVSLTLFNIMTM